MRWWEWMSVRVAQLLRLGALCAFLYVAVTVAAQVYTGAQAQPPSVDTASLAAVGYAGQQTAGVLPSVTDAQKHIDDEQARIYLLFLHQHGGQEIVNAALAALGFILLAGVVVGIMPALQPETQRLPRAALVVGLLGVVINIVGLVGVTAGLLGAAGRIASAALPRQYSLVHDAESQLVPFQLLVLIGSLAMALWLGLVGISLVRILGRRSLAAWGTIGACLLTGLGLPVLVAWCAGAGFGLWRLSRIGLPEPALAAVDVLPAPAPTPAPRSRAGGAQGSKGRRKRRR
jgi:hypothetical protein